MSTPTAPQVPGCAGTGGPDDDPGRYRLRLVVGAPTALHRDGLRRVLGSHPRVVVVGGGTDLTSVLGALRRSRAEAVVLDVTSGIGRELAKQVSTQHPDTIVIGLSGMTTDEVVIAATEAGVGAVLGPDAGAEEVVATIETVRRGESAYPPRTVAVLQRRLHDLARLRMAERTPRLSPRELEIMELVAAGMGNRQIAGELSIELSTVKNHVHNIFEKLGVNDRVSAAHRLRRHGLIPA